MHRQAMSPLFRLSSWCLGVWVVSVAPAVASAAESGPPAENQRRAAALVDIGRLRLELGTPEDTAAAAETLKQAARLDPGNIRARFWLAAAWLRAGGLGSARPLDPESAGRAGLELEAVFRLAALERTGESEDLRLRAITLLDLAAQELPASEKRFGPWWTKRRAELAAEHNLVTLAHLVARGDTLPAIAKRYYGDAGLTARITEANPTVDFRNLKAGTKLTIPGMRLAPPAPRPAADRVDSELLKQLASPAPAAERRAAAARLARRECLMAVPGLAAALRADESQWVRAECAKSLGLIGSPDAEPALCSALRADPWPGCRLSAVRALAQLGGPGAAATLLAGLEDTSPQVAAASARALGTLGLAEAAGPLLGALGSGSETLRRAAAAALADLAGREALAAGERERLAVLAKKGPPAARAAALLALARADSAAAVSALVEALDGDETVRRAAAEGLARVATAASGAKIEPKTVERLGRLAAAGDDPATALGAALAAARAGQGTPAGKEALAALAALLDEHRAIYWADAEEPESAAALAARALVELTGKRLPPERAAWTAWLQQEDR